MSCTSSSEVAVLDQVGVGGVLEYCVLITVCTHVHLEQWPDGLGGGVDVGVQVAVSVGPGDEGQVADGNPVTVIIQSGPGGNMLKFKLNKASVSIIDFLDFFQLNDIYLNVFEMF